MVIRDVLWGFAGEVHSYDLVTPTFKVPVLIQAKWLPDKPPGTQRTRRFLLDWTDHCAVITEGEYLISH